MIGAISARVPDRVLTLFSLLLTAAGCGQLFFGGFPRCAAATATADSLNEQTAAAANHTAAPSGGTLRFRA